MHAPFGRSPGRPHRSPQKHRGPDAVLAMLDYMYRQAFPHGITATHQEQINAELLKFLGGAPGKPQARDRSMAGVGA
jgi:hypothetical protein